MGLKNFLFLFLIIQGFSYDIPELPDIFKKMYRAGKAIAKEGNKPPASVQKYIDHRWGHKIEKTKREWKRLTDTVVVNKVDTIYVKDTTTARTPPPALQNTNIIIQEDDMLIHLNGDSLFNVILWE